MKHFLEKLFLGPNSKEGKPVSNPLTRRIRNINAIWNNNHQDDSGIEKIIRLFLASSQLIFLGIYIKTLTYKKGVRYQDLFMDFYILLKVLFPIVILINQWQNNHWALYTMLYLLFETILYVPTLIFASDSLARPSSYKRSLLLLFLNYFEIIFSYSVIYATGNYLNKTFTHWFDAIYFSIVTSSSIGYGDFYPVTTFGKFLVSTQSLLFLFFLVLFLNFFSANVKIKGYFDHENNS
jgi:hypothetical protein